MKDVTFGENTYKLSLITDQRTTVTVLPHLCNGRAERVGGGQLVTHFQRQLPHVCRLEQSPQLDPFGSLGHGRKSTSRVQ